MTVLIPHYQFSEQGKAYVPGHVYELNLMIQTESIQYAFYDTNLSRFLSVYEYHLAKPIGDLAYSGLLKTFFENSFRIPEIHIQQLHLALAWPYFTLIPAALYDESKRADYLSFITHLPGGYTILSREVQGIGAYIVYAVPEIIFKLLSEFFPEAKICHFLQPLLENLYLSGKNQANAPKIYVNARKEMLDIIVFDDEELVFCNSFPYGGKDDFAYFVLFTMEQLQINPDTTETILFGETDKTSGAYQLLMKYIRKLTFIQANDKFGYSNMMNETTQHKFFTLFNLKSCE